MLWHTAVPAAAVTVQRVLRTGASQHTGRHYTPCAVHDLLLRAEEVGIGSEVVVSTKGSTASAARVQPLLHHAWVHVHV